jgi:hypothetical protein
MLDAARYFFVSRWGTGALDAIQKKERSQKARLRKVRKMLQEQKASVKAAVKAVKAGEPFDLLLYHQPKNPQTWNYQFRKRVIRYTVEERENQWGEVSQRWEVDRPFSIEGVEFRGSDWPPNIERDVEDTIYYYFDRAISHIEETLESLNDFKREVTKAMYSRKTNANLLSKGASWHEALCKMDLTGWKLWERRVPDKAERARLEAAMESRKTLKMKFDPKETGERDQGFGYFVAYWSPSKWQIVFAGLSGDWSVEHVLGRHGSVNTSQFKQSLRELDSSVAHEMKHYAQSLLKDLLSLPEIAGHPGLTDPSVANPHGTPTGQHWQRWDAQEQRYVDNRIPHGVRDVEFETRLGDEVDRFVNGWEDIESQMSGEGVSEGAWSRNYLQTFLGRESVKGEYRSILWGNAQEAFAASRWFWNLRHTDLKRYQAAVSKFTAELDRLGYMKRMDRGGRLPVSVPNHPAWGLPVTRYLSKALPRLGWGEERAHEDEVRALREYGRFVDSLEIDQLRRHRILARENGGKEYWLTPRWQDHIVEPLSREEMEARRTEAQRIEHPRIKRSV